MARNLLIDEFHLTLFAPRCLAEEEYEAIYKTLNDLQFLTQLRRMVRNVVRKYPSLCKVRVSITR